MDWGEPTSEAGGVGISGFTSTSMVTRSLRDSKGRDQMVSIVLNPYDSKIAFCEIALTVLKI